MLLRAGYPLLYALCSFVFKHFNFNFFLRHPQNNGIVIDEASCGSVLSTYQLVEASHRQPTGSCYKLKQADSLLVVHLFHHLWGHASIIHSNTYTSQHVCVCVCVVQGSWRVRAQWSSVSIPARTSGSACCSWCNVCRWCSSASRPNRSPACHTASAATNTVTFKVQPCVPRSLRLCDASAGRGQRCGSESRPQTNVFHRLRRTAGTWSHWDESSSTARVKEKVIIHQDQQPFNIKLGYDSLQPSSRSAAAVFQYFNLRNIFVCCKDLTDENSKNTQCRQCKVVSSLTSGVTCSSDYFCALSEQLL